jgi:hypothetical protein
MRSLFVAVLLLVAAPAHAMGTDVSFGLIAWNADGTSALLSRSTSWDRETTDGFVVISTGEKAPEVFDVSHVDSANGAQTQLVDKAACAKALSGLQSALSKHGFTADVSVRKAGCDHVDRSDAIQISGGAGGVAASWVAMPMGRTPTARERTSWDLVKSVLPKVHVVVPPVPGSDDAIDVANDHGSLTLVFYTPGGGAPVRSKLFAFATGANFLTLD